MVPAADLVRPRSHPPDGRRGHRECNPDNVTPELLDTYRAGGVNRLSFGVQSTSAHVLEALGRTHDRDNVVRSRGARPSGGLETFDLDLIYGGASETLEDWCQTLDDASPSNLPTCRPTP